MAVVNDDPIIPQFLTGILQAKNGFPRCSALRRSSVSRTASPFSSLRVLHWSSAFQVGYGPACCPNSAKSMWTEYNPFLKNTYIGRAQRSSTFMRQI